MQVLKFGGTSVATAENIQKSLAIVAAALKTGPVVMVVSALGGTTDALIGAGRAAAAGQPGYRATLSKLAERHHAAARALLPASHTLAEADIETQFAELMQLCDGIFALGELSARTLDRLMSSGELLSSRLVAEAARTMHEQEVVWADARQLIQTNSHFGTAAVDMAATARRVADFQAQNPAALLWLVPGFIAADNQGATTTLGRGGSDYTAALLAAALRASTLEIWTDVSGMMTADPRLVRGARPIARLSYQEAMELSHFGAKVLYPPHHSARDGGRHSALDKKYVRAHRPRHAGGADRPAEHGRRARHFQHHRPDLA